MSLLPSTQIGNPMLFSSGSSPEPPTSGDFRVFFFDFDGEILKIEWVNSGGNATAPTTPTHEYLTFYGWNVDFTNVTEDLFVGAIYNTTGGETRIKVRMSTNTGLQPTIYLNKSTTDTLTINWGDGNYQTSTTNGNFTIAKTAAYAAQGDYWITITCAGEYKLGQGTNGASIFGTTNYQYAITHIYMGQNITKLNSYMCSTCRSLCYMSIGSYINGIGGTGGQLFNFCANLKGVNLPSSLTSILVTGTLANCYSLRVVTYNSLSAIAGSTFINSYALYYFKTPNIAFVGSEYSGLISKKSYYFGSNITNIPASQFSFNYGALEYVFAKSDTIVTLANTNAFSQININCKIYVADSLVSTYKAATNWITYANYIYPISERVNYPVKI